MRVIHDTEFPNSVDATQKLLYEQGAEYERVKVCVFFNLKAKKETVQIQRTPK